MSPPAIDSSDSSEAECPPAKRSLIIESSSIVPITRQQHYFKSKTMKCTFTFQWSIENFSYYCLSINNPNKHRCISSSVFSSPSNDGLQFRLRLYPTGEIVNGKKYASLFLRLENCDQNEIVLTYIFWLIDSNGDFNRTFGAKYKFYPQKSFGTKSFLDLKDILDGTSKFTSGDVLTVACEISYEKTFDEDDGNEDSDECEDENVVENEDGDENEDESEDDDEDDEEDEEDEDENENDDDNDKDEEDKDEDENEDGDYSYNLIALTQLEKDCVQLSKNTELCDVVLVFGDGEHAKEFAVHSAILSARSAVFTAMFEHDMKEKYKRRVEITDVDAEVGQELVKYLYCDSQFAFHKYAAKLLSIADKYQLDSLKAICEGALCFKITPETARDFLLLADMHQAAMLKSKCIDFIYCHASCVVESIQGMNDLMQKRPELYYELFKHIPHDSVSTWSPPTLTCDPGKLSWAYSCSSVSKCSKRWTIGQFCEIHLSDGTFFDNNKYLGRHPHDFIETSSFPSPKSSDNLPVQFSVKLWPHGENDDCKEYLSLHLQLKCAKKMKVAVKVKASIMVKENSAKGYTLEIGKRLRNGESIGWPKFITREQLMQNKDLLLNSDDQLELLFEVFYISNIDKPVTKSGVNTYANEHKFSIARDLSQFYSNQKLTDIVFSLGHKKLHAHKSIVSARSSVFARMFANTSRVQIKDVDDVEAFEQMLALVYGQTEPLSQWAHKILPLVDEFELDSLRQVCQIALCYQLNDTNVADFLFLAHKHKATMLKAKAFEYIRRNHSVLTQNDSLKVIQQQCPELFNELLCYKLDNWKSLSDK